MFYSKKNFPSPSQASFFSSLFPLSFLSLSLSLSLSLPPSPSLSPLSQMWRERAILRQWKEGRWEGKGRKGERRKGEGKGGGGWGGWGGWERERERERERKREREERLKEKREGEGEGGEKRGGEGVFIDNQRMNVENRERGFISQTTLPSVFLSFSNQHFFVMLFYI